MAEGDARDIVRGAAEEQQKELRGNPVKETPIEEIKRKFSKRVEERKEALQEAGVDTKGLISEVDVIAKEYEAMIRNRIPAFIKISDISQSQRAAGLYKVLSNHTLLDEGVLEFGMDRDKDGYWRRVVSHEGVHAGQAKAFDQNYLLYIDDAGEEYVVPLVALLEGEAVQKNQRADLTPDYVEYDKLWKAMTGTFGEGALKEATQKGRVKDLQDKIFLRAAERGAQRRKDAPRERRYPIEPGGAAAA